MRLLSFGAGGTLPTQLFWSLPATLTVHVPQSPFLQLVGTFIPSALHALSKLLPGANSLRLPLKTSGVLFIVMSEAARVGARDGTPRRGAGTNACVAVESATSTHTQRISVGITRRGVEVARPAGRRVGRELRELINRRRQMEELAAVRAALVFVVLDKRGGRHREVQLRL